jgi:subtilase family serine protease
MKPLEKLVTTPQLLRTNRIFEILALILSGLNAYLMIDVKSLQISVFYQNYFISSS